MHHQPPPPCRDPLFWFSYRNDDGPMWTVYIATERGCPDLKGRAGVCFYGPREIFISAHDDRVEQDKTVHHEMDHADTNGCDDKPRVKRVHHRTEERLVTHREPRIYTRATALGWKLPRRPRGYTALRAVAVEMNERRGGR